MEVDAMQLIQCSKDALEIAAKTTELVRQAWELKDKLPMLEMQITKAPQGANTVN